MAERRLDQRLAQFRRTGDGCWRAVRRVALRVQRSGDAGEAEILRAACRAPPRCPAGRRPCPPGRTAAPPPSRSAPLCARRPSPARNSALARGWPRSLAAPPSRVRPAPGRRSDRGWPRRPSWRASCRESAAPSRCRGRLRSRRPLRPISAPPPSQRRLAIAWRWPGPSADRGQWRPGWTGGPARRTASCGRHTRPAARCPARRATWRSSRAREPPPSRGGTRGCGTHRRDWRTSVATRPRSALAARGRRRRAAPRWRPSGVRSRTRRPRGPAYPAARRPQ